MASKFPKLYTLRMNPSIPKSSFFLKKFRTRSLRIAEHVPLPFQNCFRLFFVSLVLRESDNTLHNFRDLLLVFPDDA